MAYSADGREDSENLEARRCAICERTLLVGEQAVRFAPDGIDDFVDVCPLCQETALDHGWVREGSPLGPAVRQARRRRPLGLGAIFGNHRRAAPETLVAEPILRRLSSEPSRRSSRPLRSSTRARRCARSRGSPAASGSLRSASSLLSGPSPDVVITFSWEISWYQYRINRDSPQPVRLAERGLEPGELDAKFTAWNARLENGTGVLPDIENPG